MKKENLIVSGIIVAISLGYFIFLSVNRESESENVFLSKKTSVDTESLAPLSRETKVLEYDGRWFRMKWLPEDVQQQIVREQLVSHLKIQTILKNFLVRFHKAAKEEKDVNKVDVNKLPSLVEISSARVGDAKVEELYEKNLSRLPKGHDPINIKQQIKAELVAQDAYDYLINVMAEIYKGYKVVMPAAPHVKEEWLITPGYAPSYGSPDAPHHLIWIGYYGCQRCSQFTNNLGLVIQKFGLKNLRVTFVPWTGNDIDTYSYLNLGAFCLRKFAGDKTFWRYHSIAMNASDEIAGMKNDDIKKARQFFEGLLQNLQLTKDNYNQTVACANDLNEKNPLLVELVKAKRKLDFLPSLGSPTAFLNGRVLDLEGANLFEAVDYQMNISKGGKK